jgi:hypothetical protein
MGMDSVFGVLKIMGRVMSESLRSEEDTQVRRIGAWAWGLLGKCREVGQLSSEEVGELRMLGKRAANILMKMNRTVNHVDHADQVDSDLDSEESPVKETESTDQVADKVLEDDYTSPSGQQTSAIDDVTDGMQSSNTIPTIEQPKSRETQDVQDLEAAKARLQARLNASQEPEEADQKLTNRRRNTSSPEDGECSEGDDEEENGKVDGEVRLENDPGSRNKQTRATLDMIITIVGEFYGQRDLLVQRDVWNVSSGEGLQLERRL